LIFGVTRLLGIRFALRIKDLPDQRLSQISPKLEMSCNYFKDHVGSAKK
jgi:TnpA family transposase